jgi:hypothetical protein
VFECFAYFFFDSFFCDKLEKEEVLFECYSCCSVEIECFNLTFYLLIGQLLVNNINKSYRSDYPESIFIKPIVRIANGSQLSIDEIIDPFVRIDDEL